MINPLPPNWTFKSPLKKHQQKKYFFAPVILDILSGINEFILHNCVAKEQTFFTAYKLQKYK